MNKKIVVISLLFVLAIIAVGAVCASDNNKVTVNGKDFNIPDGYKVDDSPSSSNSTSSSQTAVLKNTAGEKITIEVKRSFTDTSKPVGETTTIDDKEGVLRSYTGEHSGQASFTYNDDGFKITIKGDASLIEEVID